MILEVAKAIQSRVSATCQTNFIYCGSSYCTKTPDAVLTFLQLYGGQVLPLNFLPLFTLMVRLESQSFWASSPFPPTQTFLLVFNILAHLIPFWCLLLKIVL